MSTQSVQNSDRANLLIISADPAIGPGLQWPTAFQRARDRIAKTSMGRERFRVRERFCSIPVDLTIAMNEYHPTIVHIAGHRTEHHDGGRRDFFSVESLDALFNLFGDTVECVIFNGCYSRVHVEAISRHVKYVIATTQEITDMMVALPFSAGFYHALGVGLPVQTACDQGVAQVRLLNPSAQDPLPMIFVDGQQTLSEDILRQTEEETMKSNQALTEFTAKVKKSIKPQLNFLLLGLAGVGKSSTINSLMGEKVAETGMWQATTTDVIPYPNEINGIRYAAYDTPGFGDALDDQRNLQYISLIKDKVDDIDCVLYVSPLGTSRVSGDEKRCIKLVTEQFGATIWKKSIIVFTQANSPLPDTYENSLRARTNIMRSEIGIYVGEQIANAIPSVAIENSGLTTPDGKSWLNVFWYTVLQQLSKSSKMAFIVATEDRIERGEIPLTETQKQGVAQSVKDWAEETPGLLRTVGKVAAYTVMGTAIVLGSPVVSAIGILASLILHAASDAPSDDGDDTYNVLY